MFPLNGEFFLSEEIFSEVVKAARHEVKFQLAKLVVRFRFLDDFLPAMYFVHTSLMSEVDGPGQLARPACLEPF